MSKKNKHEPPETAVRPNGLLGGGSATEKQVIEAQIETGQLAIEKLEAVAAFGEHLAFSLREPVDQNAEFQEMRIKTEDFVMLCQMFSDLREWLNGLKTFDGSAEELAQKFNKWEAEKST